jgi:hypothetical protein
MRSFACILLRVHQMVQKPKQASRNEWYWQGGLWWQTFNSITVLVHGKQRKCIKKIQNSAKSKACKACRVAYIILEHLQRGPNAVKTYFFYFPRGWNTQIVNCFFGLVCGLYLSRKRW